MPELSEKAFEDFYTWLREYYGVDVNNPQFLDFFSNQSALNTYYQYWSTYIYPLSPSAQAGISAPSPLPEAKVTTKLLDKLKEPKWEPTPQDERAAISWLVRLNAMLADQVEEWNQSGGRLGRSKDEAKQLYDEYHAQLYGVGWYEDSPRPVVGLDQGILSEVETHFKRKTAAEQKEIEAEERRVVEQEAEQFKQYADVVRQQAQLPLNIRGDRTQQITAGYQAIKQLQDQIGAAPYLKRTIEDQIKQIQEGIANLQQTEREVATQRTREARPENVLTDIARQLGMDRRALQIEMAVPEELSKLSPKQRTAIQQAMDGASVVWEPRGDVARAVQEREMFKAPTEAPEVGGTLRWQNWFARSFPEIQRKFGQLSEEERRVTPLGGGATGAQTWAKLTAREEARLREEFATSMEPEIRQQAGRFAPRVRTVRF